MPETIRATMMWARVYAVARRYQQDDRWKRLKTCTLQQSSNDHDDGANCKSPSSSKIFTESECRDAAEEATDYLKIVSICPLLDAIVCTFVKRYN
jgi:hypothetical protein